MSGFVGTVTTEAQLNTDIQLLDGTAAAGTYTITFGANITEGNLSVTQDGTTVLPDLDAINLHTGVSLAIIGNESSVGLHLDGVYQTRLNIGVLEESQERIFPPSTISV